MHIPLAGITVSLKVLVIALVATALGTALLLIPLVMCITICCVRGKKVNHAQSKAADTNVTAVASDSSYEEIVTHLRTVQFEMNSNTAYDCNPVCA